MALSERRWRAGVVAAALLAFALRIGIAASARGGADLRIYTYFGRLALHGLNPFAPPAGGEFPALQSDNPPVEIALFRLLLGVHDAPITLRVLFAAADAAVIVFAGLWLGRPRAWRAAFIAFYALNPFVLIGWTALAEDKVLAFLGLVVLVWAVEAAWPSRAGSARGGAAQAGWIAWTAAAALAAVKFLGVYVAPLLVVARWEKMNRGRARSPIAPARGDGARREGGWVHRAAGALWPATGFLLVTGAGYLLWFPQSVETFSRRGEHLGQGSLHASWTLVLDQLGIGYGAAAAAALTALALLAVVVLTARRRLSVAEGVVWVVAAGFEFLPNNSFQRLLLVFLTLLLICAPSGREWIALWVVTVVCALAADVAVRGVPGALSGVAGPLREVFGHEATVRHALWMHLPIVIAAWIWWRGRTPLTRS